MVHSVCKYQIMSELRIEKCYIYFLKEEKYILFIEKHLMYCMPSEVPELGRIVTVQ